MPVHEKVPVELADDERYLLRRGLLDWGGPARCTEELAIAMGFRDIDDLLHREGPRIAEALDNAESLTRLDWTRALLATEIAFASDVLGSGTDWRFTSGMRDEETILLLRAAQTKLGRARAVTTIGTPYASRPGA